VREKGGGEKPGQEKKGLEKERGLGDFSARKYNLYGGEGGPGGHVEGGKKGSKNRRKGDHFLSHIKKCIGTRSTKGRVRGGGMTAGKVGSAVVRDKKKGKNGYLILVGKRKSYLRGGGGGGTKKKRGTDVADLTHTMVVAGNRKANEASGSSRGGLEGGDSGWQNLPSLTKKRKMY